MNKPSSTSVTRTDPSLGARVDGALERALAERRIVGAVVLVARDGRIIYHRSAGFADRERRAPMQEDAIFRLSSVSKPIVTAAGMRLIEQGRIGLDDHVTRWLPDFRPRLADGSEPLITVRHLLTHTAGLSYRFFEPASSAYHKLNISDGLDQPGLGLDENLRRLAAAPLAYPPGEGWRYSLAIDVLGAVIAEANGRSLPEVVRDTVTAPLGMTDTDFSVADSARLVTPYADGRPEPVAMTDGMIVPFDYGAVTFAPSRVLDPRSYPSGGTGMVGTAGDVMRFLEAIRRGGAPILMPQTVAAMMKDQVGLQAQTQGPGWGFGYGWGVLDDPALTKTPQAPGTVQWGGAYGHSFFVDPTKDLTVIALTNTALEGMYGAFPVEVRDAIYQQES